LLLNFFEGAFRKFKRINIYIFKKNNVIISVIPIMLNKIRNDRNSVKNIIFGNFKILTNRSFISDNSDLYYDTRSK
jgi:hypothetical protein